MPGNPPAIIRKKGIYGYIDTSGLFSKGHTIWNWHNKIGDEAVLASKAEAPERTGALKQSIGKDGPIAELGRYSGLLEVKVFARRRYSIFVHEGTTGPIRPKRGKYLKLGSTPLGIPGYNEPRDPSGGSMGGTRVGKRLTGASDFVRFPTHATSVAGQDPNPFLSRGLGIVGARHRWRGSRLRTFSG
jgi:hypothetical protein